MKRFYKEARAVAASGGYEVALDGKPIRTPARAPMVVANEALAEAIAEEWRSQGEKVEPLSMPLTRIVGTAIDRVAPHRDAILDDLANYAGTDLVCYRAEQPVALVARQQALWQPVLDWACLRFDAPLAVTSGIIPRRQPAEAISALRSAIAGYDDLHLTVLHLLTTSAGSLVLALAAMEGRLDAAGLWDAAELDESFQIEQWGEDAEAAKRRAGLRRDMEDTLRFLALLRA